MKNKTSQSGFTLIELIAVMVILGILAAVIIPRISTITSGAYESNMRAMYGLIKNEVNAFAVKQAMTGGAGGHLERYPNGLNVTPHYYLEEWVEDYDKELWSQFADADGYVNGGSEASCDAVVFMYHPHGRPAGNVNFGSDLAAGGASATSVEDIYWIYYAPRTSVSGKIKGRTFDGFVMSAYKGNLDWTFDASTNAAGAVTGNNETVIPDLTYLLGN